jgi:hypothetical protein
MEIVVQASVRRVNAWRAVLYQHDSTKFYILRLAIYLTELAMDAFWTIVVILVILWLVGFLVFSSIGPLIHLLIVIAVIVAVYRLLTGRHILSGKKR